MRLRLNFLVPVVASTSRINATTIILNLSRPKNKIKSTEIEIEIQPLATLFSLDR